MLFNSYEFILLFLPISLIGFFWISKISFSKAILWLVLVSLFFYGWWSPGHLMILLFSAIFNFFVALLISNKKLNPKYILIFGISLNLLCLGYFKYLNFLINSMLMFSETKDTLTEIILPLGISFFTFTQIAFLVDVYQGKAKEYKIDRYLLFVTYFPHLIAGPLIHHSRMMPQFLSKRIFVFNKYQLIKGFSFFTIGLVKKLLIADNFAIYANSIFDAANYGTQPDFISSWVGAVAYTFQLYFDFSGYCDMAIGISLMFGIKLPINFNSPYKAKNIIDFWRRWHITLSSFLKHYLYIPLGGNRNGDISRHFNIFITMLLGGLWHGASWTFIFWGALHGLYIIINHIWINVVSSNLNKETKFYYLYEFLMVPFTFFWVVIAWIFFRAKDLESALIILKGCFGYGGISLPNSFANILGNNGVLMIMFDHNITYNGVFLNIPGLASVGGPLEIIKFLCIGFILIWVMPNSQEIFNYREYKEIGNKLKVNFFKWKPNIFFAFWISFLFVTCFGSIDKVSTFLYYQF